jgi:hypothetical protein
MKKELEDSLLIYLGELMYDFENCNSFFDKQKIAIKIDAINILLGTKTKKYSIDLTTFVSETLTAG